MAEQHIKNSYSNNLVSHCGSSLFTAMQIRTEDEGNSSRDDFNTWVEHAATQRDFTVELLKVAKTDEEKARQIKNLRENLNHL